jgi:ATP-dependent DNA helicase RecG
LARSGLASPAVARRLQRLGIETVADLLFHLPRRYDDFRTPTPLRRLAEEPPADPVSARVRVVDVAVEPTMRRRIHRVRAWFEDDSGRAEAVWFGRQYVERRLLPGQDVIVSGKVKIQRATPRAGVSMRFGETVVAVFQGPVFGPADSQLLDTGRIVPVYRLTEGVSATVLRRAIRRALDEVGSSYPEYLPVDLPADDASAPGIARAIEDAHFPDDPTDKDRALGRLAFDELLALQVGMVARDRQRRRATGRAIETDDARLSTISRSLEATLSEQVSARTGSPTTVELTGDQQAAVAAIRSDLAAPRPMLRLLQGDVGSGKTAVAAFAMAVVADAGRQAALLAPTDLLARQHAATLTRFLAPLGHQVTMLTGSLRPAARREALARIGAPGHGLDGTTEGRIVVGTHALVEDAVAFDDLALAIIDEQHRFGVAQREALGAKGSSPHVLLMTATPIPQTLGRVLHADLDVTDLRVAPAGRQSIATGIRRSSQLIWRTKDVPGQADQPGAYPLLLGEIAAGRRAFVVVPLVEEDPASEARSAQATAADLGLVLPTVAETFAIDVSPRVGVVHGQMPARQRDEVMDRFRAGDIDLIVGTTVVEVGVDVPEATVMLIFDADRFGLAQLHQLRGRVGRGADRSYCILVSDAYDHDEVVTARLDAVVATQDGFELAEKDLELRREGELLGLTQSGLPPLRIATLADPDDQRRSVRARGVAEALVDEAGILRPGHEALAHEMTSGWLRRVGAGEALAAAGETDDDG